MSRRSTAFLFIRSEYITPGLGVEYSNQVWLRLVIGRAQEPMATRSRITACTLLSLRECQVGTRDPQPRVGKARIAIQVVGRTS